MCESIVILYIEPRGGRDIYVFVNYIPPVNSSYHNTSDIDLFVAHEDSIAKYSELGNILAIGDFNSRTGTGSDFIPNDRLAEFPADVLLNVVDYTPDVDIVPKTSEDITINQFGRTLLTPCKTTGPRILNGRHSGDRKGNITFYNANVNCLIDYLLLNESCFDLIQQCESGNFNCFFPIIHQCVLQYIIQTMILIMIYEAKRTMLQ